MNTEAGNEVVFTIAAAGDAINVTARRSRAKIKANNPLRGKIIFNPGDVAENFRSTAAGSTNRSVWFTPTRDKGQGGSAVKTSSLNADGSFEFTDIPTGTYEVMLGGKLIAKGLRIGGE